jgi:hypothetical protein
LYNAVIGTLIMVHIIFYISNCNIALYWKSIDSNVNNWILTDVHNKDCCYIITMILYSYILADVWRILYPLVVKPVLDPMEYNKVNQELLMLLAYCLYEIHIVDISFEGAVYFK